MTGLLCTWLLLLQAAPTRAEEPAPAPESAPEAVPTPTPPPAAVPAPDPELLELDWLDAARRSVERNLGGLVSGFDHFFGDDEKTDLETPSTRFRFKTFGRFTDDQRFVSGSAVAATFHLPRLQERLGNARLVLLGESSSRAPSALPTDNMPTDEQAIPVSPAEPGFADLSRNRGTAELRFDLLRYRMLVLDTGVGFTLAWQPAPLMRYRAHLRVPLGAGLLLRATQGFFVELGRRGPGISSDLLVERFLWQTLRLRWEGHALLTWYTRGVEWNTLAGAEWKVRPRTGLFAGVGANFLGTPSPGLDTWRIWIGVRRDLWRDRIFVELEPQLAWPRPAGEPRDAVPGITLRLELVLDSRPSVIGGSG